jgi:hypothetical protein
MVFLIRRKSKIGPSALDAFLKKKADNSWEDKP